MQSDVSSPGPFTSRHIGYKNFPGWRHIRALLLSGCALLVLLPGQRLFPQSGDSASVNNLQASPPAFEVASIRAHKPGYWPSFERRQFTADGFTWLNAQVQAMIVYAYDLRDPKLGPNLIPGAPKWIRPDWYDIRAKFSATDTEKMSRLNAHQREAYQRELVRSLLADRFNLKAHLIAKPSLAYNLVIAKNGPKNLKEAASGEPSEIEWVDAGYGQYHSVPLDALVMLLQMQEDCPVVDKTGLKGKYDFVLKWERAPETMPPPGTSRNFSHALHF
jgi:uncharacterized protein (TIGR03435 family)